MPLLHADAKDNVAVALQDLDPGEVVSLPDGGRITVKDHIPASHKIAVTDIASGETVLKYGQPIGCVKEDVAPGAWVHTHNLGTPPPPSLDDIRPSGAPGPAPFGPETFLGYTRPVGPPGVRNRLLILPSVSCADGVARAIGRAVPQAVVLEHTLGCAPIPRAVRSLVGCATHPNVGAVLAVGLGCEGIKAERLSQEAAKAGKKTAFFEIQSVGGTRKATRQGIELAQSLWAAIADQKREPHPVSALTIGLECGGSDALSGITANPAVGRVADWVISRGGTAILSETTEMIGTVHLLMGRAVDAEVCEQVRKLITGKEEETHRRLGPYALHVIAPGNMEGGLSTIMEKSLGCVLKGGTSPIQEVVQYADKPKRQGLVLMDTPGYDVESLGGLVAGGSQIILFTTGRGSPVGAFLAPVVKVASNSTLFNHMVDDMDFNAGEMADGQGTLDSVGSKLIDLTLAAIDGGLTKSEENEQEVIGFAMTAEAF